MVLKKPSKDNKTSENIVGLNVSPRDPRDYSIDDLITLKNGIQNSEEDINIEVELLDLEEVHTQQYETHNNEEQVQEFGNPKGNNKKGPSVITRAHSKQE